jgi:hypothetical protein
MKNVRRPVVKSRVWYISGIYYSIRRTVDVASCGAVEKASR